MIPNIVVIEKNIIIFVDQDCSSIDIVFRLLIFDNDSSPNPESIIFLVICKNVSGYFLTQKVSRTATTLIDSPVTCLN